MRRWSNRVLALLCLVLLVPFLPRATPTRGAEADPPALRPATRGPEADFFGIVGRDPWYEWNTDPARFPNDVNRDALEGMARDLAFAGAGWIRIEMRAEFDPNAPNGSGYLDWRKWDWFINECAPRYGLKVLLLLGSGLLAQNGTDPATSFARINADADRPDGTNDYIRQYTARAKEVADHFGDKVAAYELLNEPNISDILHRDTNGQVVEFKPEQFGALLAEVYGALKPAHPRAQLIVGGLLYGSRGLDGAADFDYLYVLYRTKRLAQFRAANGRYPFDGVASHAYFVGTPGQVIAHFRRLHGVMVDAGDTGKLWLTELGIPGTPPTFDAAYLAATATKSEQEQAQFIRELYPSLLGDLRGMIATVFWFKYEDFPFEGKYAEYGLVRLPITPRQAYLQPPTPRKPAFAAFQAVANPAALPTAPEDPARQPADAFFFPQTGHAMSGAFRAYWEKNGGLARFGYPLTAVFEAGGRRVQYFERARFEWHPTNPDPHKVQLGLLTAFLTQGRAFPRATPIAPPPTPTPAPTPSPAPGAPSPTAARGASPAPSPSPTPEPAVVFFAETGHNLGGEFLKYWRAKGGLSSYGYPISEELQEVNQADGKTYTVQYFERARLEYHPENANTDFVVLLGLMGAETLATGGWYR